MELLLLGTGGADGWPSPWCRCGSCLAARAAGELRAPSGALLDGRILLDLGPETPRQALRAGIDLADVDLVLVTHVHSDHCDPAALLYRGWATQTPLILAGPAPVTAAVAPWLDPAGGPVTLRTLTAGERLTHDGYAVRALPATHDAFGECLLWDVTGPDGARLLYATDTGPFSPAFVSLAAGTEPYDLVVLEETFGTRPAEPGHHDLASFGAAVARLRELGLVTATTRVVATHLSHHNPPGPGLADALAAVGAEPGHDLARLTVRPVVA